MSGSLNKVQLIGRLGKDPDLRYTSTGTAVVKFSLATDESFTDRAGDKQTRREWHYVAAWNKLAEICGQYLKKGKLVYIEGKIQSHEYESEGIRRRAYEIVASRMLMLGNKSADGAEGTEPRTESSSDGEDGPF